jgi:mannose/fructose/N-acetylgalactosamine-specific phosphotransferase system component IIB
MAITLYRIDDRLIHGQVVVGWVSRSTFGCSSSWTTW